MDQQHYWAIAERDIEIQNPITDRKLRLLDDYCDVRDGLRVLDIGCGKAWVMRQWAERFAIEGIGLELNSRFIEAARQLALKRGIADKLTFVHGKALDYKPDPGSFDIVMCLGATFALGGFVEALEWMAAAAKPGGSIVVGDITLKHRPLVKHGPLPHDANETMAIIERHGGEVSATISASEADFERYASHHRHATLIWARQNPDHPDTPEILAKSRADWLYYQQTIRPHLGWTIFVARRAD
ncbi:MAG TPA: class I SAM-dependent methyltransferase [Alphaproteobacteria bacterium]|nr:class I SAM-dependent methyltransferase [Alphaproteobacteria bacterium]